MSNELSVENSNPNSSAEKLKLIYSQLTAENIKPVSKSRPKIIDGDYEI